MLASIGFHLKHMLKRKRVPSTKVWEKFGFKTRSAIEQHVRSIIAGHSKKDDAARLTAAEETFFMNVIVAHHPNGTAKLDAMTAGFSHVEVRPAPSSRNYCFYLVPVDGRAVDISWVKALNGAGGYERAAVARAAREAVKDTMTAFRRTCNATVCGICETKLRTNAGDGVGTDVPHVDHAFPQFVFILDSWLALQKSDVVLSTLENSDGEGRQFIDARTASSFKDYHDSNCSLRLVHASCNLKRKRV